MEIKEYVKLKFVEINRNRRKFNFKLFRPKGIFQYISVFIFLLISGITCLSSADLTVTFINVGQIGDSILIQSPSQKNILIDGGLWYAGKEIIVPVLQRKNIQKLDTVVLTHPHGDHYGGLEYILKYYEVGEVIDTGIDAPVEAYWDFLSAVKKNAAEYKFAVGGEKYDWGGVSAVVLNAKNEKLYGREFYNNHSIVIKLIHDKISFLFTGDIEKEAEAFLVSKDIKSTVLKVAHHGSSTSSTYEFIKKVNSEVAVITVGYPNDYGLPVPATVEKYRQLGIKLYRTDIDGNIEIISDGKSLKIQTEKISEAGRYSVPAGTVAVNLGDFWMYMDSGWSLVREGKFSEAAVRLKNAVAINPNSADAHSRLGYAYKKTKNFALAEKEFLKAISLNDKEYYARLHLGLMYYYDDKSAAAIKLFRKALEVEPQGRYTDLLNEKIKEIEKKMEPQMNTDKHR